MKVITQEEFDKIYKAHLSWLYSDGVEGEKANLSNVDFTNLIIPKNLNLTEANLDKTNFSKADLSDATFSKANLAESDLSYTNLKNVDFAGANLTYANLSGSNIRESDLFKANLSYANLSHANLTGADLSKSTLINADLSNALLIGTILKGTDLTHANLKDVNLRRVNLSDAILSEPDLQQKSVADSMRKINALRNSSSSTTQSIYNEYIINNYYDEIKKLEKERLSLIASAENKDAELEANKEHLNKLKIELQEREELFKNTIEKINVHNIDRAFKTLIDSGLELDKEVLLLRNMIRWYFGGVIGCIILLLCVWAHFFYKVESFIPTDHHSNINLLDIWVNLSPSVLLVGLLLFFIYQIHKCQRHKVILKKLLYKPNQIKGILEAYIYISGNNETSNIQINKVLDDYVCHIINHDIDTDKEESRLKETDKKDASTNEQLLNIITEVIKKVKL
ncbi:pentapeptide repeat-containing protein [Dysgonomonas sp. Shenzhen-Wh21]|uniref:pentapeptide repeat-containing protein n=1 Tax=Dysgonomonas TaxID=156973 RepID=UPI00208EDFAD|nr:pentapeptide repeat-containing protein [Dysgonomonas mossii]